MSLDNNYLMRVAAFGTFWSQEHPSNHLDEIGLGHKTISNHLYVATAISLGSIAAFFQRDVEDEDVDAADRDGVDDDVPIG